MMSPSDVVRDEATTRMACALCRRRKLRCDRQLPCDSCTRLGFTCSYEASRSYQGTKKKAVDTGDKKQGSSQKDQDSRARPITKKSLQRATDDTEWNPEQMRQEDVSELEHIYFKTFHLGVPILHEQRYLASTTPESRTRPPNYLRYIICALAACITGRTPLIHHLLYRSARDFLEETEYHDTATQLSTITRPQAWMLVAFYELSQMQTYRWSMSTTRAVRLIQMMGLHALDDSRSTRRSFPVARDWVELEEQRRAFWASFCLDKYSSLDCGCPVILDEQDIHCLLPVSDQAYQLCTEEPGMTLKQALLLRSSQTAASLPPTAALVSLIAEWDQKLKTLQRNNVTMASGEPAADLWQKVNFIDEALSHAFLIPPHLAESGFSQDPLLLFLHMGAPSATIILHKAAEEQASSHGITPSFLLSSQTLRLTAAEMIASTIRLANQLDVSSWHPFTGHCLSTAAHVFMRALSIRKDEAHERSLKVLLDAICQLQAINPQAGDYLKRLDAEFPGMRLALSKKFADVPFQLMQEKSSLAFRSTPKSAGNPDTRSISSVPSKIESQDPSASMSNRVELGYRPVQAFAQDMSSTEGHAWQPAEEAFEGSEHKWYSEVKRPGPSTGYRQ